MMERNFQNREEKEILEDEFSWKGVNKDEEELPNQEEEKLVSGRKKL